MNEVERREKVRESEGEKCVRGLSADDGLVRGVRRSPWSVFFSTFNPDEV